MDKYRVEVVEFGGQVKEHECEECIMGDGYCEMMFSDGVRIMIHSSTVERIIVHEMRPAFSNGR